MDYKLIGNRIQEACNNKNITLEYLAASTHTSFSLLSRYQKGLVKQISKPLIQCISDFMNVNPYWLIGESDDMSYTKQSLIKSLDFDQVTLLKYYYQLNPENKQKVIDYTKDLCKIDSYKNPNNDDSNDVFECFFVSQQ